ncbi:hypothetical protein ACFSTH_19650 [Paenibacillus yanchengensis]|uniref:Uncharacterized protein n=1 Tax=Paenibacillus yanchengensis TaxID=2035833 RepID=A0ABW4YMT0_9BACL
MFSVVIAGIVSVLLMYFYIVYLSRKRQFKELSVSLLLLLLGAWMYIGMLMKWPVPNPLLGIEVVMKPFDRLFHMLLGG